MVTNGDDFRCWGAAWSPASDWIAVTIAPAAELNSQVYVGSLTAAACARLTDGAKTTMLSMPDRRRKEDRHRFQPFDPASRDCFVIDVAPEHQAGEP